jgi:tyrosyl-tRNA synthetase
MPVHALPTTPVPIVDVLAELQLARSKSQARRLIEQGGVRLDGVPVSGIDQTVSGEREQILQVGKRRYARLVPQRAEEEGR